MPLGSQFGISCRCCPAGHGCCGGDPTALTLFLTPNAGSSPGYIAATLTFQASPVPGFPTAWWSPLLTTPGGVTLHYRYILQPCFGVAVIVFGVPTGVNTVSSLYGLNPAASGNSCSPLLLKDGTLQILFFIGLTNLNFANFTVND